MSRFSASLFLLSALLLFGSVSASAQTAAPRPSPRQDPNDKDAFDLPSDPENEMKIRSALKAEQKAYDDNVARAREASELGTQILDGYNANKNLGANEAKKLDKLEKLAKKIRNEAGGLNSEAETVDEPGTLEKAVTRVADLTGQLRKDVEKTPKHVVSAVVIDRANDLIGLIQRVRRLVH